MSKMTMRDAFLNELYEEMKKNKKIVIITVDFGAPSFDKIRRDFPKRVINIGIAEQNAINVGVGLALEGYIVYVYGIAPFISMRAYEQIRVNMAILNNFRTMNINIIAVGVGMSYSTSGPTHHCLEDMSLMRILPNIEIFSPSDYELAKQYLQRSLANNKPKYIRFDGESVENMTSLPYELKNGFRIFQNGSKAAFISTAYMSNKLEKIKSKYKNIKMIDLFLINAYNKALLEQELDQVETLVTLEEGFIGAGGLDAEINFNFKAKEIINLGIEKNYTTDIGNREFLHSKHNLGFKDLEKLLEKMN